MILLVGASASGKTALSIFLREHYSLSKAITYTTRSPRQGEKDALDYFFVTEEEFEGLEKEGAFVETTCYNGNHYGSSKSQIANDKVLIVDPNGLRAYKKLGNPSIIAFYINTSEETRRKRMVERGDKSKDILKRLENDKKAFDPENVALCDHFIDNEGKPLSNLAEEVYRKYEDTLNARFPKFASSH